MKSYDVEQQCDNQSIRQSMAGSMSVVVPLEPKKSKSVSCITPGLSTVPHERSADGDVVVRSGNSGGRAHFGP